jgi:subtilase family serine protease
LKRYILTTGCSVLMLLALTFFAWGSSVIAAPATTTATSASLSPMTWQRACATAPTGYASCFALIAYRAGSAKALSVSPFANSPGGSPPYAPANLHAAYNLPTSASGTPTVAIVDAYNDPNAASDLSTYRSQWGLPACTTSSGCFKKVSQTGSTTHLPSNNTGWGLEISLDLDMVSAICENCHILLVEANSASFTDLGAAVNEAASLGAIAISNSYGASEFSSESSYCSSYYHHDYIAVTASTGDGGPGVEFPSVCPYVVGIGGTTLNSSGSESAWSSAGGGCSRYISKPSWQSSSVTGCSRRAVADVSADADPNTGVYVYDSYGGYGWVEVGGTSESSPISAAVYALAGNVSGTQYPASLPWNHYTSGCLFKVSGLTYAYQAGLGTPNGTGCF